MVIDISKIKKLLKLKQWINIERHGIAQSVRGVQRHTTTKEMSLFLSLTLYKGIIKANSNNGLPNNIHWI